MRLVVLFDKGAVTPGELLVGLSGHAEVLVVLGDSAYAEANAPILEELAELVPLSLPRAALLERLRAWRPQGIVTFAESMLIPACELAQELGLTFHTPDTVHLLRSKSAQRARLAETGVQATRSLVLEEIGQWPHVIAELGLPLVVKPEQGEGSRNTYRIDDAEAGRELVAGLLPGRMVAEEFLHGRPSLPWGDFVSVESVVCHGRVTHLAVTGKFPMQPPFRETGHFWPADLPAVEMLEIQELTTRALHALGVTTGITHTEIKLTADGPRIIEVNGRVGGQINELAVRAAGIDLVRLAARIACGEDVAAVPVELSRVYFQYHNIPPLEAGRFVAIDGMKAVRKVPGVRSYSLFTRPPAELTSGVMTHWIDAICGDADDHESMLATVEKALAELTLTFE